jgi:hypothetical protein
MERRMADDSVRVLEDLRALIRSLPVPSAPPDFAQREGALGLALMDLSLGLDHVSQLAEHLTLVDRGHMTRLVSVDVDLSVLSQVQRDTLTVSAAEAKKTAAGSLWVPISRYSRRDLAPVVVKEPTGEVLPRLALRDATRVTTAGFLRLFAMLLEADTAATQEGTPVYQLLHTNLRSRWLIEAAIADLVTVGSSQRQPLRTPVDHIVPSHRRTTSNAPADSDAQSIRQRALAGLNAVIGASATPQAVPFGSLLQLACRQYMLVVLLSSDRPRRFLTWEAPLLPARRPRAPVRQLLKNALPVNREFTVEYETVIPRSILAYHLTVEVHEEISVRRFVLSSDVDMPFVDTLARDLRALAAADRPAEELRQHRKLHELELQGMASRVAELGRRRLTNLVDYETYIAESDRSPRTRPLQHAPHLSRDQVVEAMGKGDCSVGVLAAFAAYFASDELRHLASSELSGPALAVLADGLTDNDVGHDVTTDNDPREHGAHAHWRRPSVDLAAGSPEPVRAVAYLALADEAPALIESITRMVIGLAFVVAGIGTLLFGGPQWLYSHAVEPNSVPQQADAVVAVLLLVPGLLLARLDLPSTNTVLGQLRRFQRFLAVASVAVTTVLAMAVGTVDDDHTITRLFEVSLAVLAAILACCLCEFVARAVRRRGRVPRSAQIPRWLRRAEGKWRLPVPADAVFDARGEM